MSKIDEVREWIVTAGVEIARKVGLDGPLWVDCYSDTGFGRLMSFGLRAGKVTEEHVEPNLAKADPVYPLRLVVTPEGQSSFAAWLRERSWDLARPR